MKCYKCGTNTDLKNGLCTDCYKEILVKKNLKHKKNNINNYILSKLNRDEKIITKTTTSNIVYTFVVTLLAISIILFPRTIIEFFFNHNNLYFITLLGNILIFFLAIYISIYFMSRELYLTNKRIIGKWGLFSLKTINIPLNIIESIDTYKIKALEIDIPKKIYLFDYISNADDFKLATINQIKYLINSTDNENELISFSHSLNEKLEEYKLEEEYPNMIQCKCCKKMISKESFLCVHCGQPIVENEREADFFLKLICFILPPFGTIIFLLNIGEHPKFAKQCLISSILSIFIIVLTYLSIISVL